MSEGPRSEWAKGLRVFGRLGAIGIEMGVAVAIGLGIGVWLDGRLGTGPAMTIVFLLLGVAAGFRSLWRQARAIQQEQRDESKPPHA